jgi:hypothetical protein
VIYGRAESLGEKKALLDRLLTVWENHPSHDLGQIIEEATYYTDLDLMTDYEIISQIEQFWGLT